MPFSALALALAPELEHVSYFDTSIDDDDLD